MDGAYHGRSTVRSLFWVWWEAIDFWAAEYWCDLIVHSKGDQSWVFFGRNDAKAETPVLWPPHAKSWLIGKDPDAGRDWGQEEKGMTEDEMAGWHHRLDGHEFGWTPGVGDGQGGLVCYDSRGRKESDAIEQLNWTDLNILKYPRDDFDSYVENWWLVTKVDRG